MDFIKLDFIKLSGLFTENGTLLGIIAGIVVITLIIGVSVGRVKVQLAGPAALLSFLCGVAFLLNYIDPGYTRFQQTIQGII